MDLLQRQRPEILTGVGVGIEKVDFGVYKSSNIFETRQDRTTVVIEDNRKSYKRFRIRLVLKSTTLDDLEGSLCTPFQNTCATVLLFFIFTFELLSCKTAADDNNYSAIFTMYIVTQQYSDIH